jgi:hypothetical protein
MRERDKYPVLSSQFSSARKIPSLKHNPQTTPKSTKVHFETHKMRFQAALLATFALLTTSLAAGGPDNAWTVRDFTRDCTNWQDCIYRFDIDDETYLTPCTISDEANTAAWHEWYNVPCEEARPPFLISSLSSFLPAFQVSKSPLTEAKSEPRIPHLLGLELPRQLRGYDRCVRPGTDSGMVRLQPAQCPVADCALSGCWSQCCAEHWSSTLNFHW